MNTRFQKIFFIIASIFTILSVVGFAGGFLLFDSAGYSKAQVRHMPIKKQYKLLGERLDEMSTLVAKVQLAINDGDWQKQDIGVISAGGYGYDFLLGATQANSYYLHNMTFNKDPGITGKQEDLIPFIEFLEKEKWSYQTSRSEFKVVQHTVVASTPKGWVIEYTVSDHGVHSLQVFSRTYWGDRHQIRKIRLKKLKPLLDAKNGPEISRPGWSLPY